MPGSTNQFREEQTARGIELYIILDRLTHEERFIGCFGSQDDADRARDLTSCCTCQGIGKTYQIYPREGWEPCHSCGEQIETLRVD